MPIRVSLSVPNNTQILEKLLNSPLMLDAESDTLDVTEHVLAQDMYGKTYTAPEKEAAFLGSFTETPLFLPGDLDQSPELIGTLNENFIKWIKCISEETKSNSSLTYTHERGDYFYEVAKWEFNYMPDSTNQEIFTIAKYDGQDTAQWTGMITRKQDGQIVKENNPT